MKTIPLQQEFRPALPTVFGPLDYREFRETLIKIDEILTKSGLEDQIVTKTLSQYVVENQLDADDFFDNGNAAYMFKKIRHALRCNIARHLTGESYRRFSVRLADSQLFQWFLGISDLSSRKGISK